MMNFFLAYLLTFVAFFCVASILFLAFGCLGICCHSCIDYARQPGSCLPRRNLMPKIHFPSFRSLWPRRNNRGARIPLTTQWRSPVISSIHRTPREAHQNNIMANTPPMTNQSQRTSPSSSGHHQSNAVMTTPVAAHQSSFRVPMPCGCGAHQSNISGTAPLSAPQPHTMTPMRYPPNSSSVTADVPVTILQSQVMAHITHEPRRSQMMTPDLRYGPQANARAHDHTPHRHHQSYSQATHQPRRLVPERREGPNRRNSDMGAYISASMYQRYENDKNTECAVCLDKLKRGEMVMRMPLCSHVYHEKCICRWLLQDPSCPLCRSPVRAHLSVRVGDS